MNTLTIILLIYVILDIISNLILIVLIKRKGIRLTDLAYRLRWLCKKEKEIVEHYEDYFYDEDEVDDQGYGY